MATDSIQVAIRVRPLIRREKESSQQSNWRVNGNSITQISNGKLVPSSCFTFDRVFDQIDTTEDIYEKFAKPMIESAMLGFNATIFAYGQTSSGKTFTMLGGKGSPGIIQLAITNMFDHINEDPAREYLLVVAYMEIYNEVITDLLNPTNKNLKIHENTKKEVFVSGITQCPVNGSDQIYRLMAEGEKNRHFGETNMNERSSRSHTIFAIDTDERIKECSLKHLVSKGWFSLVTQSNAREQKRIESRERVGPEVDQDSDDADGAVLVSQLNLVDLAGSERVAQTGAEGLRLKEGAHINKSLFTLGSVIAKLSEGECFIPFRDSKLTRILQSSLGGNAKTGMLCTVTPASIEESVSTLKFASRAKTIKNCPSVNEVLDDGAMLKRMKKEIRDLRQQISKLQENTCLSELQSENEKFQKQLEETKADHEKQIQKLTASFLNSSRLTEKEGPNTKRAKLAKRRETWCPGAMLSSDPLESAAALAQSVWSNFDSSEASVSGSSEESDTNQLDFISSNKFEKMLVKEERKRRSGDKLRRVKFSENPPSFFLRHPSLSETVEREIQTENNDADIQYKKENEDLRIQLLHMKKENDDNLEFIDQSNNNLEKLMGEKSDLEMKVRRLSDELRLANDEKQRLQKDDRAAKYRNEIEDLKIKILHLEKENTDNLEFIDQSNNNLECLMNEKSELERKLHYAIEEVKAVNAEKTALQLKVNLLDKNAEEEKLQAENKELREQVSELQNECNLVNSCAEDLQGEVNELKKENIELKSRLQEIENATEEKQSLEAKVKDYEQQLEVTSKEISQLKISLEEQIKLKEEFFNESISLKVCESSLKEELDNERNLLIKEREDMEELILDLKEGMIDVENERSCLQEEFQCLLLEKDSEISSLMNELNQLNQNLSDFEEERREEVESMTRTFQERLSSRDATISELVEDAAKLQERLVKAECEVARTMDLEIEKKALSPKYEDLQRTKDNEIAELRQSVEIKDEELGVVKEELKNIAEWKRDVENNQDQLQKKIEKLSEENEALYGSLEKITIERDEFKNELSDTITDSVAIQKDIFEAHQKVADYKQRLKQMNQEYENMCMKVSTLEEELLQAKGELEIGKAEPPENIVDEQSAKSDEYKRIMEDNEELKKLNTELKLVNEKLQVKMESVEDIETLKTHLATKDQELQVTTHELDSVKQSTKELQHSYEEMKGKVIEMEDSRQDLKKRLADKQECCERLCKEMNEYKISVTGGQPQNKTFNIELEELRKEHGETVRELHNEQKEHEVLRAKYEQLKEQIEDNKVSLLRDSNRELTQQKQIDKMRSERRETICVQAQLRVELEKERDEKEKKILELETRCRHLNAEKDLNEHKAEVSQQQLEDIKQQMKDMEVLYSQHSKSVVPTSCNDKSAHRLKQVEFNLDITKQKLEKAEVKLKELEHENRQLKGADIRNNALLEERDAIKSQLVTKTETLRETNRKLNELSIEVTQLKSHMDKVTAESKKQKAELQKKVEKIEDLEIQLVQLQDSTNNSQNFDEERKSLRQEIEGLQSRLKSKSMKCEELSYEIKELQKKNTKKASKCDGCSELESCRTSFQETAKKLEKVQGELNALKIQHEELSFKYDEQLMLANEKEVEKEDAARLKDEISRLKAEILHSRNYSKFDQPTSENQDDVISNLNMTIQAKDEELEHLTFLMDERELEINEIRNSLQEYEGNVKQLKETIRENSELSDGLRCEVEMFKIELEETNQGRKEDKKRIEELRNIIKEQEAEIIRLGENLHAVKIPQDEGQTDKNEDLMSTVDSLRKELEEVKSSKDDENIILENIDLRSKLESAQHQIEEQKTKVEESMDELKKVVAFTEDGKKEYEELQIRNGHLQTQLEAAQQVIEERNSKLEEGYKSIEELKKVASSVEDAKKKYEEMQSQNKDLETRLQAAQQQIEEGSNKLEEAYNSMKELKKVVNSDEDADMTYVQVRNEKENLQFQLEAAQQQIAEQNCKLEQSTASIEMLRRVITEQEEEIFNAKDEDGESNALKQELEWLKQDVEDSNKSLQEEQQLCAQLKMFLKEKENEVEELLAKQRDGNLIELQNSYEEVKTELEKSKEAVMSSQNELQVLRNSNDKLKEEYEEARKMVGDFERRNNELQDLSRGSGEALLKVQSELEQALRKVLLSETKMEEYEQKIRDLVEKGDVSSVNERESHEQSEIHILAKQAELEDFQERLVQIQRENAKHEKTMQQQRKQLTEMQNCLIAKQKECAGLREKLKSGMDVSQEKVNALKGELAEMSSALSSEKVLNEDLREELESSKRHVAAVEDALQKTRNQKAELECQIYQEGRPSKQLADVEAENIELRNNLKVLQEQLDEQRKKPATSNVKSVPYERYDEETNRLKKIIDEVQDEIDKAELKIHTLEQNEKDGKEQRVTELQSLIDHQKAELEQHVLKIQKLEEEISTKDSEVISYEYYTKETDRLKGIIDEVQDELEEAELKIHTLEQNEKDGKEQRVTELQSLIDHQKAELEQHVLKIQKLEKEIKTKDSEVISYEYYTKETDRLKRIIDEVQDELDEAMLKIETTGDKDKENEVVRTELQKALNENERLKTIIKSLKVKQANAHQEENLESLRIELASKNMKIQELQYKGLKVVDENERLKREVEYGYAKLAKMKQEVRKMREESTQENTIQLKAPSSTGDSDVGVVSSVAVFSLKAKVGQLESENDKLKREKEQLERDKVTLSLMKTDAGNQVSVLTTEVAHLRRKLKELSRASQHVLAPSNTPDDSTTSHAQSRPEPPSDKRVSRAARGPSKETENRPAISSWLSPSKANEIFQDKPNQCQHQ